MPRVRMAVARERRARVLACLYARADEEGRAVVSLSALAGACGLSLAQARSVLKYLAGAGLLRVERRSLPNGGFAENAYRLSEQVLAACRR